MQGRLGDTSCGVLELSFLRYSNDMVGMLAPKEYSTKIIENLHKLYGSFKQKYAIVVFSDWDYWGAGQALCKAINATPDMGPCVAHGPVANSNTYHPIRFFVWLPSDSYQSKSPVGSAYVDWVTRAARRDVLPDWETSGLKPVAPAVIEPEIPPAWPEPVQALQAPQYGLQGSSLGLDAFFYSIY